MFRQAAGSRARSRCANSAKRCSTSGVPMSTRPAELLAEDCAQLLETDHTAPVHFARSGFQEHDDVGLASNSASASTSAREADTLRPSRSTLEGSPYLLSRMGGICSLSFPSRLHCTHERGSSKVFDGCRSCVVPMRRFQQQPFCVQSCYGTPGQTRRPFALPLTVVAARK